MISLNLTPKMEKAYEKRLKQFQSFDKKIKRKTLRTTLRNKEKRSAIRLSRESHSSSWESWKLNQDLHDLFMNDYQNINEMILQLHSLQESDKLETIHFIRNTLEKAGILLNIIEDLKSFEPIFQLIVKEESLKVSCEVVFLLNFFLSKNPEVTVKYLESLNLLDHIVQLMIETRNSKLVHIVYCIHTWLEFSVCPLHSLVNITRNILIILTDQTLHDLVTPVLSILCSLTKHPTSPEVLSQSFRILKQLMEKEEFQFKFEVFSIVIHQLLDSHHSAPDIFLKECFLEYLKYLQFKPFRCSVLKTLANLCGGSHETTQIVLETRLLDTLNEIIDSCNQDTLETICLILSNIAAGNEDQAQSLIFHPIFPKTLKLLDFGAFKVKVEVSFILRNLSLNKGCKTLANHLNPLLVLSLFDHSTKDSAELSCNLFLVLKNLVKDLKEDLVLSDLLTEKIDSLPAEFELFQNHPEINEILFLSPIHQRIESDSFQTLK